MRRAIGRRSEGAACALADMTKSASPVLDWTLDAAAPLGNWTVQVEINGALAASHGFAVMAGRVFADDFSDGASNGWTTSGGAWSVGQGDPLTGHLVQRPPGRRRHHPDPVRNPDRAEGAGLDAVWTRHPGCSTVAAMSSARMPRSLGGDAVRARMTAIAESDEVRLRLRSLAPRRCAFPA
jgi:hypothetical protein